MNDRKKFWNGILLFGVIFSFVFGGQMLAHTAAAFWTRDDIYWTPVKMAEPLRDTENVFQLTISGTPLADHLKDGTLKGVDAEGKAFPIVPEDIRVRINHYPAYQVHKLTNALIVSVLFGIGLGFLLVVVMRRWRPSACGEEGGVLPSPAESPERDASAP